MNGYDHFSSTVALAKQIYSEVSENTRGEISLPRSTVKLLCEELISHWTGRQQETRSTFKKVP